MKCCSFLLVLGVVSLCSCTRDSTSSSSAGTSKEGREETRVVEALGVVGYDGSAVRRSVDRVLDADDKRNEQMQAILEE